MNSSVTLKKGECEVCLLGSSFVDRSVIVEGNDEILSSSGGPLEKSVDRSHGIDHPINKEDGPVMKITSASENNLVVESNKAQKQFSGNSVKQDLLTNTDKEKVQEFASDNSDCEILDDVLSIYDDLSEYDDSEGSDTTFDGFDKDGIPKPNKVESEKFFEGFGIQIERYGNDEFLSKRSDVDLPTNSSVLTVANKHITELCTKKNVKHLDTIFDAANESSSENFFEGFEFDQKTNYKDMFTSKFKSDYLMTNAVLPESNHVKQKTELCKNQNLAAASETVSPVKVNVELNDFIGPYCQAIGCTISWLESGSVKVADINNGIVFELSEFAKKIAWERKYVAEWILRLHGFPSGSLSISENDLKKIHMVNKRRKAISVTFSGKYLLKPKLSAFDRESFSLPSEFILTKVESNNILVSDKTDDYALNTDLQCDLTTSKNAINVSVFGGSHDPEPNLISERDKSLSQVIEMPPQEAVQSSDSENEMIIDEVVTCESEKFIDINELSRNKFAARHCDSGLLADKSSTTIHTAKTLKKPHEEILSKNNLSISEQSNECVHSNFVNDQSLSDTFSCSNRECISDKDIARQNRQDFCPNVATVSVSTCEPLPCSKNAQLPKFSFGQHIKFASKKGKDDFTGKHIQYPIFEIRDNNIGPFCDRDMVNVETLNFPKRKIIITNGMVIELYIFFKERGATLTSLVFKLRQLMMLPLKISRIQCDMTQIQEVVNMELHKKTDYYLEKVFSFIYTSNTNSSILLAQKVPTNNLIENLRKDPSSPATSTESSILLDVDAYKASAISHGVAAQIISCNVKQSCDKGPVKSPDKVVSAMVNVSEDADSSSNDVINTIHADLDRSKGRMGNITRGDIVKLYYDWLQLKNKDKDSVFVIDLLNEVEKLMISRQIDVIRIPVGTLMSSSVKLFEEYQQFRAFSQQDALSYLEDDWLEDIQYLVSVSKTRRATIEDLPGTSKSSAYKSKASTSKLNFIASRSQSLNGSLVCSTDQSTCSSENAIQSAVVDENNKIKKESSKSNIVPSGLKTKRKSDTSDEIHSASVLTKKSKIDESNENLDKTHQSSIYPAVAAISGNEFIDLTFEYKIELILSTRMSSTCEGPVYEYLIQWSGTTAVGNTWVAETDFPPACIFLTNFWETNPKKILHVKSVVKQKDVVFGGTPRKTYLVIWSKYNSESWLWEEHFPDNASVQLQDFKKLQVVLSKSTSMKKSSLNNGDETGSQINKVYSATFCSKADDLHVSTNISTVNMSNTEETGTVFLAENNTVEPCIPNIKSNKHFLDDLEHAGHALNKSSSLSNITNNICNDNGRGLLTSQEESIATETPESTQLLIKTADRISTEHSHDDSQHVSAELDSLVSVGIAEHSAICKRITKRVQNNLTSICSDANLETVEKAVVESGSPFFLKEKNDTHLCNQEMSDLSKTEVDSVSSKRKNRQQLSLEEQDTHSLRAIEDEVIDFVINDNTYNPTIDTATENKENSCSTIQVSSQVLPPVDAPTLPKQGKLVVFDRKPRDELLTEEEKQRSLTSLKKVHLSSIYGKNSAFSTLTEAVLEHVYPNSYFSTNDAGKLSSYSPKKKTVITQGRVLAIYDEWRASRKKSDTGITKESFTALRNRVKSLMDCSGNDYDFDDCLLGVCYSLYLSRLKLRSVNEILEFNATDCFHEFVSFKKAHLTVLDKYYNEASSTSNKQMESKNLEDPKAPVLPASLEKTSPMTAISQACADQQSIVSSIEKINRELIIIEKMFSGAVVKNCEAEKGLTDMKQTLAFLESEQKQSEKEINEMRESLQKEQALKSLKECGIKDGDLSSILEMVAQNLPANSK